MPSLLDTVKSSLQSTAQPSQVGGIQDTTSQVQALRQAQTGKAGGPSTAPKATSLQEQISTGQAALGAEQLAQQGQVQAAQVQQQEQGIQAQEKLQQRELSEQQLSLLDNYANQATRIQTELFQQGRTLDLKKDAAKIEQLGFASRLANDQYLHQLDMEAKKSQLDNDIAFDEALTDSLFDEELSTIKDDLAFKQAMSAKDADFQEYLGQINLDFAMDLSASEAKAQNQRAIWEGVSGLVSAGAGAYATQQAGGFDKEYQASGNSESGKYQQWKASQNAPTAASIPAGPTTVSSPGAVGKVK